MEKRGLGQIVLGGVMSALFSCVPTLNVPTDSTSNSLGVDPGQNATSSPSVSPDPSPSVSPTAVASPVAGPLTLASTICQGITINGVLGTANCLSPVTNTVTGMAAASTSTATTARFLPPAGTGFSSLSLSMGSGFLQTNICSGNSIFGLAGTASCSSSGVTSVVLNSSLLASTIGRSPSTIQVSQIQENGNYANQPLPLGYRDVATSSLDDDGSCNSDAVARGESCPVLTPVVPVTYAQHVGMQDCGQSQASISARISDCLSKNPTSATWTGATSTTSGEAVWKLVTRNPPDISSGACSPTTLTCIFKEVWQDQRTGYLWTTMVAGAGAGTGMAATNWCRAAGNVENIAGVNCAPGGGLQPNPAVSFCAEVLTPGITGENWVAGTAGSYTYDVTKGGMGRYSSPSVMWRLPSRMDEEQAWVDGLRFVVPDLIGLGPGQREFTSTVYSDSRSNAYIFGWGTTFFFANLARSSSASVRCVGRGI